MNVFFFIVLIFIPNLRAEDLNSTISFTWNSTLYRTKLLHFADSLIGLVANRTITFNKDNIRLINTQIQWDYYPTTITSRPIKNDNFTLVALIVSLSNNTIRIMQFNKDLSITPKAVINNVTLNQQTCGFSTFINNTYLISFINSSNNGIIGVYEYSSDSLSINIQIDNFYNGSSFQVFQCEFINETNIIICLQFRGNYGKYKISLYNSSFSEINATGLPLYSESTDYQEGYLDLIKINVKQYVIIKSFSNWVGIDLILIENNSVSLLKQTIKGSMSGYPWKFTNYCLLNENYLLVVAPQKNNPGIFLIFIPELNFYFFPFFYLAQEVHGYDVALIESSQLTLVTFGVFNLNEQNGGHEVWIHKFNLLNCTDVIFSCTGDEMIIDLKSLTNSIEIDNSLQIGLIDLPNETITFQGIRRNRSEFEDIQLNDNSLEYGYTSVKFVCNNSIDRQFIRYFLFREQEGNRIKIPSFICTLEIIPCYPSCKTCMFLGNQSNHNCSLCKDGYGFIPNTSNCYLPSEKPNYYQATDSNGNVIYLECGNNCLTCTGQETQLSDNCIKCKDGMFLIEDKTKGKCYTDNPGDGYYLDSDDNNTYKQCYERCRTCEERGDKNNNKCFSCKNKYGFLSNTLNCITLEEKPNNYYKTVDTDGNILYLECGKNCLSCFNGETSLSDNCIECINGMYFKEDEVKGKCFKNVEEDYYLDLDNKTYKKCFERCSQCDMAGDISKQHCLNCKNEFGLLYGTSNCISYEDKPSNYYENIDNNGFKVYLQCNQNCLTCTEGETQITDNCIKCKDGMFFVEDRISGKCYSDNPGNGYYLDIGLNTYKKCYESCLTCKSGGDFDNHNCLSCKNDYEKDPINTSNCVFCKSLWYQNQSGTKVCAGENCPSSFPFLNVNTKECVSNCGTLYQYYNNCYSTCPSGTNQDDDSLTCHNIMQDLTLTNNSSSEVVEFTTSVSSETFIDNLDNAVSLSLSSSSSDSITVIKTEEMSFSFYPSTSQKETIQNSNSPVISLGECENILKHFYNIREDEELYIGILIFNNKVNFQFNKTRYVVYDSAGRELNISVCDDVPIKETKKLNIEYENLNYQIAQTLAAEVGVNIYNSSEEVFNDKCIPLQFNGKDTTLTDRKNKIQSRVSLCEDNCNLIAINYTTNEVECDCLPQKDKITINSFVTNNEIYNQITNVLSTTNLVLFTCFNTVNEIRNITKNYGAIMSLSIMFIEVILMIIFLFCQLKPMFIKITKEIQFHPPQINSISHLNLSSESYNNSSSSVKIPNNRGSSKDLIIRPNYFPHKNEKLIIEEFDPEELNSLDFEEAKEKDHRSFGRYYINIVSEKQVIFSPILYHSIFQPLSLRLTMFAFCLHIFLFLNALFFTEEYISKRYDSNDKLDFMYIIQYELNKSILASVAAMIIQKLFSSLTTTTSVFFRIIHDNNDITLKFKLRAFITKIKIKIIILFTLIISMSILFLYFLNTFCYIYKSNQISWVQSTLLSIAGNIIIYLIICLLLTIIRFCALKWNQS